MEKIPEPFILHLQLNFAQIQSLLLQAPFMPNFPSPLLPVYTRSAEKTQVCVEVFFGDFIVKLYSPRYKSSINAHHWFYRFRQLFLDVRLEQSQLHFSFPSRVGSDGEICPDPVFETVSDTSNVSDHDDF